MRFSLVMATIGRVKEVERFLKHLDYQTYRDFELIIVDQNPDNRLVPLLKTYEAHFPIVHLRSAPGLSRARNVGLKHISGDIVAFPDDDCWYPQDLLENVVNFFREHPTIDILTGCLIDNTGKPSSGHWDFVKGTVNRFNVWKRGRSASMFVRVKVIKYIGEFDENLGIGAETGWGAGEETDYLLRALKVGFVIYYNPAIRVYHPQSTINCKKSLVRAYSYGMGVGRVLKKHCYPFWFVLYQWLRSLGGAFLALFQGSQCKARYYLAALKGKVHGWLQKQN